MGANKTISTTVNGPVYSTGGSITVTGSGVIDGGLAGVYAQAFDITMLSNAGSILGGTPTQGASAGGAGVANSQTITTLINTGTIRGGDGESDQLDGPGGDGVLNSGTISALTNAGGTIAGGDGGATTVGGGSGGDGVFNRNGATISTLTNFGTIKGGYGGQSFSHIEFGGPGGNGVDNAGAIGDLFNTGKIESGYRGGGSFGFTFGVFNQTGATITALTNTGSIYGSTTGVENVGAIAGIFNTGTIEGGSQGFSSFFASFGVVNENGATITTLTNSGTIEGGSVGVLNAGTIDYLFNSGTIEGGLNGAAISSTGSILLAKNTGKIDGEVFMAGSGETFINQAKGVIDGKFKFGWYDFLCNDGKIDGAVTLSARDWVGNRGVIQGDVTLGAYDWLGNRGAIQGEVTLGSADVYDDYVGSTVGQLIGSTQDLYEFNGKYGDVTIENFAAGSGATHATLQFAANDFGSLTALQNATTQVNGNVVIRLDSTDAVTLVNLKLSDLATVDFKLV